MKNNFLVLTIVTAVILIGLFFILKPKNTPSDTQKTSSTNSATQSAAILTPTLKSFDLVIKENKLLSGSAVLQVKEGEDVIIKISGDKAEELHLHGYDISVEFEPGKTAELKFTAALTGRFTLELEKAKIDIGVLEVLPK